MIRFASAKHKTLCIDDVTLKAYAPQQLIVEQQDGEGGWRVLQMVTEVDVDKGYAIILHRYGTAMVEETIVGNFRIVVPA